MSISPPANCDGPNEWVTSRKMQSTAPATEAARPATTRRLRSGVFFSSSELVSRIEKTYKTTTPPA